MNIENTQSQMRKGVLEYCILAIIRRNEDAAVDDQELALGLEHRHVAPDLAQPAERRHAHGAIGDRTGVFELGEVRHAVSVARPGPAPVPALSPTGSAVGLSGGDEGGTPYRI